MKEGAFFTILSSVLIIFCFVFNILGFLVFYLNKARRESVAIIPDLIMICFFCHAVFNFSNLITFHFDTFFRYHQIPYFLNQMKIYFFIDRNLMYTIMIFNLFVQSVSFCIALAVEMCYCVESILFFRNPIGSTVIRKCIYCIVILVSFIVHCTDFELGELKYKKDLDETNYLAQSIRNLSSDIFLGLSFAFVVFALVSIPIIHITIKTQAVFFIDEKKAFKRRHIIYSIFTSVCVLEIIVFKIYFEVSDSKISDSSFKNYLLFFCLNIFGLCGCFIRILEIDLLLFCGFLTNIVKDDLNPFKGIELKSENKSQSASELDIVESYGGDTNGSSSVSSKDDSSSNASTDEITAKLKKLKKKKLRRQQSDMSSIKKSLKTDAKQKTSLKPLSIKIMSNFICETVYYVVSCILLSADEYETFQRIEEKDYTDYIVHTLQVYKSRLTHSSDHYSKDDKSGFLSFLKGIFSTNVEIIEYAPKVFHNMLRVDGVDNVKLKESFDIEKNADYFLNFQNSEGKSGSVFFFTYDKRFIIKTISIDELNAMLHRLLRGYYNLAATRNTSNLMRIYGLFTMKMGLSRNHLILMENIAPFSSKPILYKFDLKGSYQGRKTKILFNQGKTLKDLDYLELNNKDEKAKIFMSQSNISKIKQNLKGDLKLLQEAGLMDYSYFVAVVNKKILNDEKLLSNKRCFECPVDKDIVYFAGIIDYLTPYGKRKKLENLSKRIVNKKDSYSAVNPGVYKNRFQRFLLNKVFFEVKEEY